MMECSTSASFGSRSSRPTHAVAKSVCAIVCAVRRHNHVKLGGIRMTRSMRTFQRSFGSIAEVASAHEAIFNTPT